tara:strand:+ start:1632 stop:2039 length:408 start_codon:yes stop_codon:yes gene_type:complete
MNLEKIINVAGWPGLYKIISQAKNLIIVESIENKKKSPLNSRNQANMLEEIGIYTYEDTKPLSEIFEKIAKKENYNSTINHKSDNKKLTEYFRTILNDYDEDRVYISDIKKVFQWYNILQKSGLIKKDNSKKDEI